MNAEREARIREACELARLTSAFLTDGSLTPAEWIADFWKPVIAAAGMENKLCAGYESRKFPEDGGTGMPQSDGKIKLAEEIPFENICALFTAVFRDERKKLTQMTKRDECRCEHNRRTCGRCKVTYCDHCKPVVHATCKGAK